MQCYRILWEILVNVHFACSALAGFGLSACDAHDVAGKQELENPSKITEDWKAITVHVPFIACSMKSMGLCAMIYIATADTSGKNWNSSLK